MILCVGLSPALGRVVTLSQFDLGAVNRATGYLEVAAGKACNAARVVSQLGYEATLVSPIGAESLAQYRSFVMEDGIRLRAVPYPGRVRWAITLVDPKHGATEVVVGEPQTVPKEVVGELVSAVENEMSGASACLLAGSRLADIPREIVPVVARSAQAAGVPLFLDIRGGDLAAALAAMTRETGSVTVKINEEEFTTLGAENGTSHARGVRSRTSPAFDLSESISAFARHHRCNVVVTRGDRPVIYAEANGDGYAYPVPKVEAVNPIGSGDTFLAALAVRHVERNSLESAVADAIELASRNATLLRPGTIRTH